VTTPAERETVAACLTPPGQGAVAVVAVDGPRAWEAVRPLFRTRAGAEAPTDPLPGRFFVGRLGGEVADEVVLAVRRMGPSQRLEVHCHGGRAAVRFVLDLLAARSVQVRDWREFLSCTESDSLRSAAAVALAEAPTARTAAILLDQYHGAFAAALDSVGRALGRGDVGAASAELALLVGRAALGRRLTSPWRVAVAGPPNVGKSSLVNALAGYQRSVVAATPGTTRDVVTTRLAVDGWPVELADTAGLREGADALEMQGVRMGREKSAAADFCLWLLDASAPPIWPDPAAGAVRLVVNKVDLPAAWDRTAGAVSVSARTGAGVQELCAALGFWLVPDPPPTGAAVPFTDALCDGVAEANRLLTTGQTDGAGRAVLALRRIANL
jgi:tRNA modification GTPase